MRKFGGERLRRFFRFGAKSAFRERDDANAERRRQNGAGIATRFDVFFEIRKPGAVASTNAVGEQFEGRRRADRRESERVEARGGGRFEPSAANWRERFRRGERFKKRHKNGV